MPFARPTDLMCGGSKQQGKTIKCRPSSKIQLSKFGSWVPSLFYKSDVFGKYIKYIIFLHNIKHGIEGSMNRFYDVAQIQKYICDMNMITTKIHLKRSLRLRIFKKKQGLYLTLYAHVDLIPGKILLASNSHSSL